MVLVSSVGADAYRVFWKYLDLAATYSVQDLQKSGGSLEQIEAEFGLPSGWSGDASVPAATRIERLKSYSKTSADYLHAKYRRA